MNLRRLLAVLAVSLYNHGGDVAEGKNMLSTQVPILILSGADSHVMKHSYERIRTSHELARVWAKHLGAKESDAYRPALEVDFDHYMVVVIFKGASINVRGIKVDSILESDESISVRFEEVSYQTAGADNAKSPDTPYAFIVLPKSDKTTVVEENVQQIKGDPPKWKERASLK